MKPILYDRHARRRMKERGVGEMERINITIENIPMERVA